MNNQETSLRAIAIDDELMALNIIEAFCKRKGGILLQTFTQASKGLAAVRMECPDLLFLDIDLGNANGVEQAETLPAETCVVFTTAFPEYALQGFNLDAVDYLLKPFSYERFLEAVGRVQRRQKEDSPQAITVKVDYKNKVVPMSDIVYLEAMDNYVCLHLTGHRQLITQTTLSVLLSMLPEPLFVRIHKSYVVARRQIESFTRQQVYLRGEEQPLPVGRMFVNNVRFNV